MLCRLLGGNHPLLTPKDNEMFSEPVTLTVDYPESYYTDLPEPIRLAYKHLANLLLRDIGVLLNNQDIINAARNRNTFEINKIVERHVELTFNTMDDILRDSVSTMQDAIRGGVVEEFMIHRVIVDDARHRETFEREATSYLQALTLIALNNPRVMDTVGGHSTAIVRQVYDYLQVKFC